MASVLIWGSARIGPHSYVGADSDITPTFNNYFETLGIEASPQRTEWNGTIIDISKLPYGGAIVANESVTLTDGRLCPFSYWKIGMGGKIEMSNNRFVILTGEEDVMMLAYFGLPYYSGQLLPIHKLFLEKFKKELGH